MPFLTQLKPACDINNPRRSRIHNFFDTHFDTQLFHMHNFFLVTVEGRVNLRIVPFEPTCCKRQWIEWIMGERYSDATHSFISQLMPLLVPGRESRSPLFNWQKTHFREVRQTPSSIYYRPYWIESKNCLKTIMMAYDYDVLQTNAIF